MNPFSWLVSGSNAADKLLDGIVKGGDALFLTAEEKIQYTQKSQELWLDMQKVLATESSPRSLNRRFVAWSVIGLIDLITVVCITLALMGQKAIIGDIIEITKALWIGEAFVSVIVFYFGAHIMGKAK